MKPKLYIESTILSYLTAWPSRDLIVAGHQQITTDWWKNRRSNFSIYISQFVIDEIGAGDTEAAKKRLEAVEELELLDITDDVIELADAIIESGIIPQNLPTDAAHISVAAVHGMDFLMTWNCAHIDNAEVKPIVANICKSRGFDCPVICTPEELMGGVNYVERSYC